MSLSAEEAMEPGVMSPGRTPDGGMVGGMVDTMGPIEHTGMAAPVVVLSPTSQAELDRNREEWKCELSQVEEEIATLRQVLGAKVLRSQELKRKLGITVWREFQDDMSQGIRNVRESNVYQKTESAIKATAEKTTTLLGGLGQKLGQLKNSDSFRSIEERVSTTVTSVKSKIGTSRSNSMQGFDEALAAHEAHVGGSGKSANGTPNATTPTSIPENKPL